MVRPITDANAFGQEWQLLDTEPSLLQSVRLPSIRTFAPCLLPCIPAPSPSLEMSSVDEAAAERLAPGASRASDDCVFDVLTTGDPEMAVRVPTSKRGGLQASGIGIFYASL
jgi:hypothetical protein